MNSITRSTQTDPMAAQGILRPGGDPGKDGFSFQSHFLLNGRRDNPFLVCLQICHPELAGRRLPVRLAQSHGECRDQLSLAEKKQHPLWQVDDDPVFAPFRNDVPVVHPQCIAGLKCRVALQGIALRKYRWRDSPTGADLLQSIAGLGGVSEYPASDGLRIAADFGCNSIQPKAQADQGDDYA
jgi:hypothetical protein